MMIRSSRAVIYITWTVTGCSIHTVSKHAFMQTCTRIISEQSLKETFAFLFCRSNRRGKERTHFSQQQKSLHLGKTVCLPVINVTSLSCSLSLSPAFVCVKWSMIQFTYATDVLNNKTTLRKNWPITLGSFFSNPSRKQAMFNTVTSTLSFKDQVYSYLQCLLAQSFDNLGETTERWHLLTVGNHSLSLFNILNV